MPVNLKQKIIASEYIDLALLLINSQASLSDKHTVIDSHGKLLIEPKQQHRQIVNIETWTDAFLIFTSIYCTAHLLKFQDLLKYIHCIRLGSKRCSGGWKATSSITVVILRIMHVLSVILASGVLVNIHSFSVHDKFVLPNKSGGAPRLRHPQTRPRFQSPLPNNSVQYPPRLRTQVTASGQPSNNYY